MINWTTSRADGHRIIDLFLGLFRMRQLSLFPVVVFHRTALGHHKQNVQEDGNQNQSDKERTLIAAGCICKTGRQLLIDDTHNSAQSTSQTQHIRCALFIEHIDGRRRRQRST